MRNGACKTAPYKTTIMYVQSQKYYNHVLQLNGDKTLPYVTTT